MAELARSPERAGSAIEDARALRERLGDFLRKWDELLGLHASEARAVLDVVLADRIVFRPRTAERRYELTVPIAFDRVLTAVVPEFSRLRLQDSVASPTGFEGDGNPVLPSVSGGVRLRSESRKRLQNVLDHVFKMFRLDCRHLGAYALSQLD